MTVYLMLGRLIKVGDCLILNIFLFLFGKVLIADLVINRNNEKIFYVYNISERFTFHCSPVLKSKWNKFGMVARFFFKMAQLNEILIYQYGNLCNF